MKDQTPVKENKNQDESISFDKIEENQNIFEKLLKVHNILRKSIYNDENIKFSVFGKFALNFE